MMRIEENYTNVYENSQPRYIKDAMPELKNVQIKVDSAVFSKRRNGGAARAGARGIPTDQCRRDYANERDFSQAAHGSVL